MSKPQYLNEIWRQDAIPVLAQRAETRELFVKLPEAEDTITWRWKKRRWLRQISPKGRIPKWSDQYRGWQIPRSWLTKMTRHILSEYGQCYVVQPFRPSKKCAPNCMTAKGLDCDCSCMGENHGTGGPSNKWFVVSDTFAIKWGELKFGCRLMRTT